MTCLVPNEAIQSKTTRLKRSCNSINITKFYAINNGTILISVGVDAVTMRKKVKVLLSCVAICTTYLATVSISQAIDIKEFNARSGEKPDNKFHERWGAVPSQPSNDINLIVSAYAPLSKSTTRQNLATLETNETGQIRGNNVTEVAKKRQIGLIEADTIQTEANSQSVCGDSPYDAETIRKMVESSAQRHEVDEKFAAAIAWTESRFDRSRNSPKGARGAMQLMPRTAAQYGVKDICDPQANIEAGVRHLRSLLDEFENPLLAAAAYNAGSSRIYEYQGIPPFKETVGYVAEVVNFMIDRPMPSKKSGSGKAIASVAANDTPQDTGVIPVKKTGTFVGGVMHF